MPNPAETKPEPKPAAAAEKAVEKKKRGVRVLRVTGPERGRRRAGHAFGATAVELRVEDLSEEEIAAIQADPQLISAIGTRSEEEETEGA